MVRKSRVLIISRWQHVLAIARLPQSLAQAGFVVGAVSTSDSFLCRSRHVHRRFVCSKRQHQFLNTVLTAILNWKPDLIIPGSSWDRAFLVRLSNSHLAAALNAVEPGFRRLLIRSLGDPHHHPTLASKQAQEIGRAHV